MENEELAAKVRRGIAHRQWTTTNGEISDAHEAVTELCARLSAAEQQAEGKFTQADLDFFAANADEYFEMANVQRIRAEAAEGHLRLAEQEASHGVTANAQFIDQCVKAARAVLAGREETG